MNTELLNKALALCSEIEERQAQLKEILASLTAEEPVQTSDLIESDDIDKADLSDRSDMPDQPDSADRSDSTDESEPSEIEEVAETIETPEPEMIPAPEIAPESEMIPEPEIIPEPECTPESANVPEPAPVQVSAPQPAGDLRKAFTINDRFRFRRELFGGDDKAMLDVIARLSESQTYADSLAYIDTLGWSADNEAVGEFKEIVSTFFNGYRL